MAVKWKALDLPMQSCLWPTRVSLYSCPRPLRACVLLGRGWRLKNLFSLPGLESGVDRIADEGGNRLSCR
ncbi:unnamed protein product [Protopolystoma xenopodis]|uniref:Uncharacterized protein n=1 Tax=Protopolystoma xenopodis TaxID=117903 RepID=A0A3S5B477_9PLAT|nr:unnamed protein product [Protopolystoma xenopodis]